MKTLNFFLGVTILFFLFQIQAKAQPYHRFLENNSWYERTSYFGGQSFYWFYKSNDTLISAVNYTIIRVSSSSQEYYVREDTIARQVYLKLPGVPEELLYDFSLTPGTIFLFQGVSFFLDSIGTTATAFGNRNKFYYHNVANSSFQATTIEGIGSKEHPMTFKVFLSDPVYDVICTYIANSQYYYSGFDTCAPNPFTAIEKINSKDAFSLFPNPAHDKFMIKCSQLNSQLEIFNILGERIYSAILYESENNIELNNAKAGFYIVRISDGEKVYSQKLVIQ